MFTRCITVGICLLSSGVYVTAELDKIGEVTEERAVHVHTHTLYSHLGKQDPLLLETSGSSLTGLQV